MLQFVLQAEMQESTSLKFSPVTFGYRSAQSSLQASGEPAGQKYT